MRTEDAFLMNQAAIACGAEGKVFDWDKAAKIIKDECKKHPDLVAVAGLQDDMEWTSGVIYRDGKCIHSDYTYLASNWAIPVLVLDGVNEIPCWKTRGETKWDANTTWPKSAIEILRGEVVDNASPENAKILQREGHLRDVEREPDTGAGDDAHV